MEENGRTELMKPIDTTLSLFALLLLCPPCVGLSQQTAEKPVGEQKPVATLRVDAREVLLPVTVRDKKGALVPNLQKGDFALTQDGRPQTIKSFTKESNLPFLVGLLVDTSRSVSGAMENERKAAGKFIDQMVPAEPKTGTQADEA